jgi:hypothetical protein
MDTTSAPLADYFWIAGIDSLSYSDNVFGASIPKTAANGPPPPAVDATIEEGSEGETPGSPTYGTPRAVARHSRNNSWNRLSRLSNDARNSIQTLDELDTTRSNRSSITIKALNINGNGEVSEGVNGNGNGGGLGDFDFDRALVKFANERESFLDDLSFSAGAPIQSRPPMTNPRADRLRIEDQENMGSGPGRRSPLRSVGGSIRRRMSFRDMNSTKRQPSTVQRNGELKS